MARSTATTTLFVALAVLAAIPIATIAFPHLWRGRVLRPLPEVERPANHAATVASAPAGDPDAPSAPVVPARPVDQLLVGVFEGRGPGPGTDLMPDGPRVDLVQVDALRRTARVDLDRDGRWDEVWTIGADEIRRDVSPADDGTWSIHTTWVGGEWVVAPPEVP